MARISGMILGIGIMIVISSLASPAGAWDDDDDGHRFRRFDDDDDHIFHRHRGHGHHYGRGGGFGIGIGIGRGGGFGIGAPLLTPRRQFYDAYPEPYYSPIPQQRYYQPVPQQQYYQPVPQQQYYQPAPQAQPYYPPIQQQPIVPEPLPPEALNPVGYDPQPQLSVPPAPPVDVLPEDRPGQFVDAGVPLYPHVRVKGAEEVPAFAVPRILAVRNPDPRFPGCVYVKVYVPPGPYQKVKVEDGGAKVELDYGGFEVKLKSERGIVTVEYDD